MSKMKSKECADCNKVKSIEQFYIRKDTGKHRHNCKECVKQHNANYRKTKRGLVTDIYNTQKLGAKMRGYEAPSYTKQELVNWLLCNPLFHALHNRWVESDYDRWIKPSVDRKNDYKSYTFDNIQLMTWGENKAKSHSDTVNGVNNKRSYSVQQFSLNNEFIKEYYSMRQASRETSIYDTDIGRCCSGRFKTAGGFIWRYT